jgi:AbrB family looped-hinge helix DNA binding protein
MTSIAVNVSQGGRVVIPAEIRQKMQIEVGDQVLLDWSDETGELRIFTRKQRLQHARNLVRKYARKDVSVVDDLIQERRKAAADE